MPKKSIKIFLKLIEWLVFLGMLSVLAIVVSPLLPFNNIPRTYIVITGSMEPTIPTGSIVITKPVNPQNLKTGDIIAFSSPNQAGDTILHRIDSIKSNDPLIFSTKGDNNNAPDAWDVIPQGVAGLHIATIPYLGHAGAFIRKPLGFILLIGLPALLFILSQIFNIKKAIKDEIDKGIAKEIKKVHISSFLLVLFLSSLFSLASTSYIRALFQDRVQISGLSISVKDFVPPSVPQGLLIKDSQGNILGCNGTTDNRSITIDWSDNTEPDLAYYQLDIIDKDDHARPTESFYNATIRDVDGQYQYRILAVDINGNKSSPTPWCYLTLDRSAPQVSSQITSTQNVYNTRNFNIDYSTSGDVAFVRLCYSYNFSDYICPDQYIKYDLPSGHFSFDSPNGDGLYEFYSIAVDHLNVTEDDSLKTDDPYLVQVDTVAPTTNIDYDSLGDYYDGHNLLKNGSFEDGSAYWDAQGEGSHRVITQADGFGYSISPVSGNHMYELGFRDALTSSDATDSVYQIFSIPQNLSANLSFNYRLLSQDIADYDYFQVQLVDLDTDSVYPILQAGNTDLSSFTYDSGWKRLGRSLISFAGKTVKLLFSLINQDLSTDPLNSFVFIDDVKVSTIDPRLNDTVSLEFDSQDLGSGSDLTPTPIEVQVGENQLDYSSSDVAQNYEPSHTGSVVVLPPISLSRVCTAPITSDPSVEIKNISGHDHNLDGMLVCDGQAVAHCVPLSGNLSVGSTIIVTSDFRLILFQDKIFLKDTSGNVVDEFLFTENMNPSQCWSQDPHGLNIWTYVNSTMDFQVTPRASVNKLNFSVFAIPSTFGNSPYDQVMFEVLYQSQGEDRGVMGYFFPESVVDGTVTRDLYLGTCSQDVCTPDPIGIGSTIMVSLGGTINGQPFGIIKKSFIYQ